MSEWQPIETAPKDGSIFMCVPDSGYDHCFFHDEWWCYSSGLDGDIAFGPPPKGWKPLQPPKDKE